MNSNNKEDKKIELKKKRSNKKVVIEKDAIAPLSGGYDDADQAWRTSEIFLRQAMLRRQ